MLEARLQEAVLVSQPPRRYWEGRRRSDADACFLHHHRIDSYINNSLRGLVLGSPLWLPLATLAIARRARSISSGSLLRSPPWLTPAVFPLAQLKKVLDSVRELITDANFECSEDGIVSLTPFPNKDESSWGWPPQTPLFPSSYPFLSPY